MAMRVKPDTGEVGVKQRYRVTNWSEYDRALVNRGNLTIWFDDESLRDQWTPPPPVGRGTPGLYSDKRSRISSPTYSCMFLPLEAPESHAMSRQAKRVTLSEEERRRLARIDERGSD